MYRRWTRLGDNARKWSLIGLSAAGLVSVSEITGDPDFWRLGGAVLFFWALAG